MFIESLNKNDFRTKYLENFNIRFTYGSLTVEDEKSDYTSMENSIKIYNNMQAMIQIMKVDGKLSPYDVVDIADTVNKGLKDLAPGFRKVNVIMQGSTMDTIDARDIREAMYYLFNNYYNIWDCLPFYEREAMFHREFLHIHPFEDGNGRTARIIMNYNLMRNNKAPIIIKKEEKKKYFNLMNNNKINEFMKIIESKSKEELEIMLQLYDNICQGKFDENDEDIKIYQIKHSNN